MLKYEKLKQDGNFFSKQFINNWLVNKYFWKSHVSPKSFFQKKNITKHLSESYFLTIFCPLFFCLNHIQLGTSKWLRNSSSLKMRIWKLLIL